jgi:hypothetical protein
MIREEKESTPKADTCPIKRIMKSIHLDKIDSTRVKLEEKEIFQGMPDKKKKKKKKSKKNSRKSKN